MKEKVSRQHNRLVGIYHSRGYEGFNYGADFSTNIKSASYKKKKKKKKNQV